MGFAKSPNEIFEWSMVIIRVCIDNIFENRLLNLVYIKWSIHVSAHHLCMSHIHQQLYHVRKIKEIVKIMSQFKNSNCRLPFSFACRILSEKRDFLFRFKFFSSAHCSYISFYEDAKKTIHFCKAIFLHESNPACCLSILLV